MKNDKAEMKINKPLTVVREEFKTNLANLINESGLPAFAVTPILEEFAAEAKRAERYQYEQDKQNYEKQQIELTSKPQSKDIPEEE